MAPAHIPTSRGLICCWLCPTGLWLGELWGSWVSLLPVLDAVVRAGVSSDPVLAQSPPGSRNSRAWVMLSLQLGKQLWRSPHMFPSCIFSCCWVRGCQRCAGDSGQRQAVTAHVVQWAGATAAHTSMMGFLRALVKSLLV